ncbi:MAG TPA: crosslink repair DNA glycosylase YcaQ family protein [Candidatus Limnocylindrales bacterium]|nr:crosslink repair DNA glycosylase YcaQ family protein [Candidatus Limnocylindrales bacterium]
MTRVIELSRAQILAHRLRANGLVERVSPGPGSLRRAAWAGLTDSVPRAALLSIHARLKDTRPDALDDPALVQVWGPRFSAYAVAADDRAPFTVGRMPDEPRKAAEVTGIADRLEAFLDGRRMSYSEAGHAMGVPPNSLRYATLTGRVLLRWDGSGRPEIWMVPPPESSPGDARLELARRHLHVMGPGTAQSFGDWAGIRAPRASATMRTLEPELVPVRTPVGAGWILASDESSFTAPAAGLSPVDPLAVRLLPSGDAYWLAQGRDRALLVPEAAQRAALWPSRVWPGALLLGGEIAGTWRRADADIRITAWRDLSPAERNAIEGEARSLPLPGVGDSVRVTWVADSST